jgi:hypothetical protein
MNITNIPAAYKTNTFIFKIDFISGGGNDFYLDDINVYDAASIGIEENPSLFFQIKPNPASQYFEINGDFENAQMELMNLQGQMIINKFINNGDKISVEELSNGIYLVKLIDGIHTSYQRLIVSH